MRLQVNVFFNTVLNAIFVTFMTSFFALSTFAKSEEKEDDVCTSTELLRKTHLACVSCALKKLGRPVPDENYLAIMGLMVRENAALFTDEQKPTYLKPDRRDLNTNRSQTVDAGDGPVEITTRAQYQKSVIQMLLAGGYCTQGKIKPKTKDNSYKNVISRINSDKYAIAKKDKEERQKAIKELGYSDWDLAKHEFYMDSKDNSFFTLPFEEQKAFYKNTRTRALSNHSLRQYDDFSHNAEHELTNCLDDIEKNYAPVYSSTNDAYVACHAIYDGCEIATTPLVKGEPGSGEIYRKDAKGRDVRVGGDWCGTKYQMPKALVSKDSKPPGALAERGVVKADGTPLAPVEDRSRVPLGNVDRSLDGNTIFGPNADLDLTKVYIDKNGNIVIPPPAIKYKNGPGSQVGLPEHAEPKIPANK